MDGPAGRSFSSRPFRPRHARAYYVAQLRPKDRAGIFCLEKGQKNLPVPRLWRAFDPI